MTISIPRPRATVDQNGQEQLVKGCRYCLTQCELLLKIVSAEDFALANNDASIGTHVRHVLDRFQCFFNGLATGHIDYDARKRDPAIATSLDAAAFALASIARRVEALASDTGNNSVDISSADNNCAGNGLSVQESVHLPGPAVIVGSTVERELMGLITHTTHHLAIIAMLVKQMGYVVDKDFGKAPATIRYEHQQQQT